MKTNDLILYIVCGLALLGCAFMYIQLESVDQYYHNFYQAELDKILNSSMCLKGIDTGDIKIIPIEVLNNGT